MNGDLFLFFLKIKGEKRFKFLLESRTVAHFNTDKT